MTDRRRGGILSIEREELRPLFLSFLAFFFLLSAYFILRPLREEAGVSSGVKLSILYLGTFVGMLLAVPLQAYLFSRLPRRRFLTWTFRFFSLNLLVFALLRANEAVWPVASRFFYCWISVFVLFAVSLFWSILVDHFRGDQSRRLFGLVATGGSLGAIAGSLVTDFGIASFGAVPLFVISAILLEIARLNLAALEKRVKEAKEEVEPEALGGSILEGLTTILRSPYLLLISLFLLLMTAASTFAYFEQRELVKAAWPDDAVARTQFFSRLNLSVQVATLLIQALVVAALIRRFGMKSALVALPLVCIAGFFALALATRDLDLRAGPGLAIYVLAIFQVAQQSTSRGLASPTRQMLFAPLSRVEKYKSKNFIDTVVYRGGDMLTGFAFDGLAGLGLGLSFMAFTAMPICALWMIVALRLGRRSEPEVRLSAAAS